MKTLCGIVVVGLGLMLTCATMAEAFSDGNYLLKGCQALTQLLGDPNARRERLAEAMYCSGIFEGILVTQIFSQLDGKAPPCFPGGLETIQAARIIVRSLETHPQLYLPGNFLALQVLREAFPCQPAPSQPHR